MIPDLSIKSILLFLICSATLSAQERESKYIAAIAGMDRISEIHIGNLLQSKGIDSTVEGSVLYGVFVPHEHAEEAERILREDVQKRAYDILFCTKHDRADMTPRMTYVRLPIAEALAQDDYKPASQLGRLLRSKKLSKKLRAFPYLESLQIRERKYLNGKFEEEKGYDVRVTLHKKADDDSEGCQYDFQVWEQGHQILYQGGREWNKNSSP